MAASPHRSWNRLSRGPHGLITGCAALALVGCSKQQPEGTAPTSPTVRFVEDGSFWSAPLPSDHRLVDGQIDLQGFPNPDGTDIVTLVLGLLQGETGWGTTSGIFLPTEASIDPTSLPGLHASITDGASVYLVDVDPDSPERGRRIPVRVTARTGLVHGPDAGIAIVPLQGVPLRPNTRYAAVVTSKVQTVHGHALVPSKAVRSLERTPDPVFGDAADAYADALATLDELPAGLAVFTTGDPTEAMQALADDLRTRPIQRTVAPLLIETYDDYCVYEGQLEVTSYQTGVPPYTTEGGGIDWVEGAPQPDHPETSRFWITVPRSAPLGAEWPVAVMVRTGGGGDRPMIDRGTRDASGSALEAGEGPARYFARAGWIGFQYDGPLGGLRNPTGGDEQFLVFNVTNMEALRDNLRQSAAELAALPDFLDAMGFMGTSCPDHVPAPMRTTNMALMGHSMGATIAPLALPSAPEYRYVVLSGAGGSWIENILHKQSPLEVRPLAEAMLGYSTGQLTGDDPFLSLLQWAGESADPPVHGAQSRTGDRHFLMFQGIVDTYILPPIANTTSLSFGLDQAGVPLDEYDERLLDYEPLSDLQAFVGTTGVDFPVQGNQGVTAAVVQHFEDPVEDGHEVMFQLPTAKAQYQCFLDTARTGDPQITEICE